MIQGFDRASFSDIGTLAHVALHMDHVTMISLKSNHPRFGQIRMLSVLQNDDQDAL